MGSVAEDEATLMMAAALLSDKAPEDTVSDMEQASQQIMILRGELPKLLRSEEGQIEDAWQTYLDLGCKILSSEDRLFYSVELPSGWRVEPKTNFWSILYDEEDRIRGQIWYKGPRIMGQAWFYLSHRFSVGLHFNSDYTSFYGFLSDGGKEIYKTHEVFKESDEDSWTNIQHEVYLALKDVLVEQFPNYLDCWSYWEENIDGITWRCLIF